MVNYNPANTTNLFEVTIEKLHKESKEWLSEINFWKIELYFFQKLLEKLVAKSNNEEDKEIIHNFQNLILYYNGELLEQLEHDCREHEIDLKKVFNNNKNFNDQSYRLVHKNIQDDFMDFDKAFKNYKKELYEFAERML